MLFPQLQGKCQDKSRKDGAWPALFQIFVLFYVFLCFSMYFCVVLCIFVLLYVFLCCSMYFCVVLCIFVLSYYFCVVLCIFCFMSLSVFFVCICILYDCHRVATQLQLNLRRLMSYIYGAPILDVSRSHTTTQHSR